MSRKLIFLLLLTGLLLAARAAAAPPAGDCAVGSGPAATLLVPFFEVDLGAPGGATTLFAVVNGGTSPVLTRVVLWTDWGVPTLSFDVYLEPNDVQSFNLRDLLEGRLPATGDGVDLSGFAACDLAPPYDHSALTPVVLELLRAWHRGGTTVFDMRCAGEDHGDGLERGFVTVDVVDECRGVGLADYGGANPMTPDYFGAPGSPGGIATADNVLWGDVFFVDPGNDYAQGMEAVGIWADPAQFDLPREYTFYGRLANWGSYDDRTPLPRRWEQRFLNGGPFNGGTDLIVWQEPADPAATPIACAAHPPWYPLTATIEVWDEDSNGPATLPDNTFPLVTQRVNLDDLPSPSLPYDFGWLRLLSRAGAWVVPAMSAEGRYSIALDGTPGDYLCGLVPP